MQPAVPSEVWAVSLNTCTSHKEARRGREGLVEAGKHGTAAIPRPGQSILRSTRRRLDKDAELLLLPWRLSLFWSWNAGQELVFFKPPR